MTILEPTLYANGAIRVTDHGPRGGVVFMHVGGEQVDVPYNVPGNGAIIADMTGREIEQMERAGFTPAEIIERVGHAFRRRPITERVRPPRL